MKCIGVGHPGYRLHYAILILGVGDGKVLTCREKIIKRKGDGGREQLPMHGEIMIHDQRAKVEVTWAKMGMVKSGFIDTWLVEKKQGR